MLELLHQELYQRGYVVLPKLLDQNELQQILTYLHEDVAITSKVSVGNRNILTRRWCAELGEKLLAQASSHCAFSEKLIPVQCTFFTKSLEQNWLVPMHQDLTMPHGNLFVSKGSALLLQKDGQIYVKASQMLLQRMFIIRLHLDECMYEDGPLKVIPGSHVHGILPQSSIANMGDEFTVTLSRGGAMVMRPLLIHGSSKASGQSQRRVLHFLYAPKSLSS